MKVIVKSPFFDDKGLHLPGTMTEVTEFYPDRMEMATEEEKKAETKEKSTKKR